MGSPARVMAVHVSPVRVRDVSVVDLDVAAQGRLPAAAHAEAGGVRVPVDRHERVQAAARVALHEAAMLAFDGTPIAACLTREERGFAAAAVAEPRRVGKVARIVDELECGSHALDSAAALRSDGPPIGVVVVYARFRCESRSSDGGAGANVKIQTDPTFIPPRSLRGTSTVAIRTSATAAASTARPLTADRCYCRCSFQQASPRDA